MGWLTYRPTSSHKDGWATMIDGSPRRLLRPRARRPADRSVQSIKGGPRIVLVGASKSRTLNRRRAARSARTFADVIITPGTDHDGVPTGFHLHRFFPAFIAMSQTLPQPFAASSSAGRTPTARRSSPKTPLGPAGVHTPRSVQPPPACRATLGLGPRPFSGIRRHAE